jgi:hypothetical protein
MRDGAPGRLLAVPLSGEGVAAADPALPLTGGLKLLLVRRACDCWPPSITLPQLPEDRFTAGDGRQGQHPG